MSTYAQLESWLGPYLSETSAGAARRIAGLPASEALAATSIDPSCDPGAFDGLPGVAMLAEAALAVDPGATLEGALIDPERPDVRLHLDTVVVSGELTVQQVLAGIATVVPDGDGLDPDVVERRGERWVAWWD